MIKSIKYSSKVKTCHYPWKGTLVYTPFASHDIVSLVGSISGGTLCAQEYLQSPLGTTFAEVHASMLLEGTTKHSKEDLQTLLDSMGASLSFATSAERLVFSASVRPVHLDALLSLIQEVLLSSTFPTKELMRYKKRALAELALEMQDPRAQSQIHLDRMIMPPEHALYEETTVESIQIVEGITSTQLRRYHAYSLSRESLIVSIAGDISYNEAEKKVATYFKKLPSQKILPRTYVLSSPTMRQEMRVTIPDKSSVEYTIGIATGITSEHSDYPALVLGMQILGNAGFTGRLMQTVREKEGLTYGVYGSVSATSRIDGMCSIKSSFAPQSYEAGRASIMRQITLIVDKGVTAQEVKKHTQMYVARAYVGLSNSLACAMTAHTLINDGRTPAYFDSFLQKYQTLTAGEVNTVLKKYLVIENISESSAGAIPQQ